MRSSIITKTRVSPKSFYYTIKCSCRCFLFEKYFVVWLQVSYMILQMVSPVSHSVGNSVKRVVVIVSSVIFFRTPVSPLNSIGNQFFFWLFYQWVINFYWWDLWVRLIIIGVRLALITGTAVALAGVFLYSRAKRVRPETKTSWVWYILGIHHVIRY